MSTISEKIRIARTNRGWTQAELADRLCVSESTVQKWEKSKNIPSVETVKQLSKLFCFPPETFIDDSISIIEYIMIGSKPADCFCKDTVRMDSTSHEIYDAGLKHEGLLHRFVNKGGVPYSAIYRGHNEEMSFEREGEQGMINYWNKLYS